MTMLDAMAAAMSLSKGDYSLLYVISHPDLEGWRYIERDEFEKLPPHTDSRWFLVKDGMYVVSFNPNEEMKLLTEILEMTLMWAHRNPKNADGVNVPRP